MATSAGWGSGGTGSPRERRAGSTCLLALKWSLGLGALALIAFGFRDVELARVALLLGKLGPLAALVLLPQLVAFGAETWGWQRALRSAGHGVAFGRLLSVRVASDALGQTLPAGGLVGETFKPALLSRGCGLSLAAGVGTTAHRKFLRVLSHGVYVVVASSIGFQALRAAGAAWTGTTRLVWLTLGVGLGLVVFAVAMAALLGRGRLAARLHALLCRFPSRKLRGALERKLRSFDESDRETAAFFTLGARKTALPVLACTLSWLCEALETWLMLALLGVTLRFDAVLGVDMAVSLARQTLFLLPAGIGVQEAGYMSALGAIGVPDALTVGAAFIVLKRGKEVFWISIGMAALFLLSTRRRLRAARQSAPASTAPVSRALAAPHSAPG